MSELPEAPNGSGALRKAGLAVVLLLGSLWAHGLGDLLGYSLIAPWVIALPIALGILVRGWGGGLRVERARGLRLGAIICLFALTVVVTGSAFRSPSGIYGLAVAGALATELVLFALLSSTVWTRAGLARLNSAVFVLGAAACAMSLVLFAPLIPAVSSIAETPAIWNPGVGYVFDRGATLRLVGLVGDPNFFALFASLPLMIGLGRRDSWWSIVGTGVVGVAILLTYSRSLVVASALVLLGYGLVIASRSLRGLRTAVFGAVAAAMLLVAAYQVAPVRESVESRIERVSAESRFNLWGRLTFSESTVLVGEGLGAARARLGRYSHNTFLDFTYDTGLLGLLFFGGFIFFVSLAGLRNVSGSPELRPWLLGWFVLVLMLNTFSLGFNPLLVTWGGILASPSYLSEPQQA